jgi:membrane-associated protein
MAVEIVRARRGRTASEEILDEAGEAARDLRDQAY